MTRLACHLQPYGLRFHGPFVTASGTYALREGFLVRLTDADGASGWGEVAPLPGRGTETLTSARAAWEAMVERLVAWLAAGEATLPATFADLRVLMARLAAVAPDAPAARAGVDLALADLAARRSGVPLARWLSADARPSVPVNATIGAVLPDRAARRARAVVDEGFGAIKVKVGTDDLTDLERVVTVCTVVGRRATVRADANGAWDALQAEVMLEALVPHHLEYVEQPVPGADIAALAALRRRSRVPLAADEALFEPDGVARVLDAEAADVLVLKPTLLGGLATTWAVAESAAARGVEVVVTTALESAIGRTGALHLAAALPGLRRACGLATGDLLADDVADAPRPRRGSVGVPEGPGLGVVPQAVFTDGH
jgi:L-Ala-D/L-Glu epimerase